MPLGPRFRIAVALGFVLAVFAVGQYFSRRVGSLDEGVLLEAEPNDTLAQAQLIRELPTEIRGRLAEGDRDLFRLPPLRPDQALLEISVEGPAGTQISASRPSGASLASATTPGRLMAVTPDESGTLVTVSGSHPGEYVLRINTFRPEPGVEREPNDAAHPSALEPRGNPGLLQATGWWSTAEDVDCFQLAPASVLQMARIEFRPPTHTRAHLEILDAARRTVATREANHLGQTLVVPNWGLSAGEGLLLCVRSAEGQNFFEEYDLHVKRESLPAAYEFEPNDTRESATEFPLETPVRGFLPEHDVDWFRITTEVAGTLRVFFDAPSHAAGELTLLGADGGELVRGASQPGKTLWLDHAGVQFIRLRTTEMGDTEHPYRLFARPATDE